MSQPCMCSQRIMMAEANHVNKFLFFDKVEMSTQLLAGMTGVWKNTPFAKQFCRLIDLICI